MVALGDKEGQKLEFKRADVLEDPANVAREVAALLNTEGGKVWIGVIEEAGVAVSMQTVPNPEAARSRLHDALVSRVEPSPTNEEVRVVVNDGLLCVEVDRGRRGPYAFLEKSMRGYVIRVGARLRPLSLDELRERFSKAKPERPGQAEEAIAGLRGPPREKNDRADSGLFVFIAPSLPLELDLRSPQLEPLLRAPESSGNRAMGWNFSGRFHTLKVKSGVAIWKADFPTHQLMIDKKGDLVFSVPLERLQWQGEAREVCPWVLAELILSVCRLYPLLAETSASGPPPHVLLATSLRGIATWTLKPYSPNSAGYHLTPAGEANADLEPPPLLIDFSELKSTPDRCGWRLLEQLYDDFGFGADQMPPEFNRATNQFVLPS